MTQPRDTRGVPESDDSEARLYRSIDEDACAPKRYAGPEGIAPGEHVAAEEVTDEDLMAQLATGQRPALEILVGRYQTDIFRFCLHYLREVERARELAQETFIRVYTASVRFDNSRKFRPWLLCIARNLCLNELKRRKTVPMESLEGLSDQSPWIAAELLRSSAETPYESVVDEERRKMLSIMLESLNDESREIVTLRFFEKMQAREIAEIIGSTEGAVRTKLHRILMSLREKYAEIRDDL